MGGAIVGQLRFLAIEQSPDIQRSAAGKLGAEECNRAVGHHKAAEIRYCLFFIFEETDLKYLINLGMLFGRE